jgi:hypothetical protein
VRPHRASAPGDRLPADAFTESPESVGPIFKIIVLGVDGSGASHVERRTVGFWTACRRGDAAPGETLYRRGLDRLRERA